MRVFDPTITDKMMHYGFRTEFSVRYQEPEAMINIPHSGTYTVIFAAYRGNRLTAVEPQAKTYTAAQLGEQSVQPTSFQAEGADRVRVFLWNSLEGMRPLAPAA